MASKNHFIATRPDPSAPTRPRHWHFCGGDRSNYQIPKLLAPFWLRLAKNISPLDTLKQSF